MIRLAGEEITPQELVADCLLAFVMLLVGTLVMAFVIAVWG